MKAEEIGERLHRKIVTPVYSDDRKSYTCGCIVTGSDGSITVRFYRYENGKGIVGRSRPTSEVSQLIKKYAGELKAYVSRRNEIERKSVARSDRERCQQIIDNVDNSYPSPGGRF